MRFPRLGMSLMKKFNPVGVIEPSQQKCPALFLFLHGSGDNGMSLCEGIRNEISLPHMRIIFPTAPLKPYTLWGGELGNVWFDRVTLEPKGVEDLTSVDAMAKQLCDLVQAEVDAGCPKERIIIGGFSMGACMALHLGLRFLTDIAGIVTLSTFLYNDSEVYRNLAEDRPEHIPPVLFCHGENDDLIDIEWSKTTYEHLRQLGVQATFRQISNLKHAINEEALDIVKSWVIDKIPLV